MVAEGGAEKVCALGSCAVAVEVILMLPEFDTVVVPDGDWGGGGDFTAEAGDRGCETAWVWG